MQVYQLQLKRALACMAGGGKVAPGDECLSAITGKPAYLLLWRKSQSHNDRSFSHSLKDSNWQGLQVKAHMSQGLQMASRLNPMRKTVARQRVQGHRAQQRSHCVGLQRKYAWVIVLLPGCPASGPSTRRIGALFSIVSRTSINLHLSPVPSSAALRKCCNHPELLSAADSESAQWEGGVGGAGALGIFKGRGTAALTGKELVGQQQQQRGGMGQQQQRADEGQQQGGGGKAKQQGGWDGWAPSGVDLGIGQADASGAG